MKISPQKSEKLLNFGESNIVKNEISNTALQFMFKCKYY